MKTYLVGGAVRDRLLGMQVVDRDYVVVGATPSWSTTVSAGVEPGSHVKFSDAPSGLASTVLVTTAATRHYATATAIALRSEA